MIGLAVVGRTPLSGDRKTGGLKTFLNICGAFVVVALMIVTGFSRMSIGSITLF